MVFMCWFKPANPADLPCVPNDDDNSLDANIHEMRWCTPCGGMAN